MTARIHVLFLNAHGGVGADTDVHLSLARTFDRSQVRVSAAVSAHEPPGASAREAFERIAEVAVISAELGRTLASQGGLGRAVAVGRNLVGVTQLIPLARWCRTHAVDIVHVTERPRQILYGLVLARLAGAACLVHAHTSLSPQEATPFGTWRLRQADAVVGVSRFTANSYARFAGLPLERVFAVHNAVDTELFSFARSRVGRPAMRQYLGLPSDALVVGCIARLMRWKGQDTLLEAFAGVRQSIPQARLVLAGRSADTAPDGQGDYRDYLERRIRALGLEHYVSMPGFLAQARMPEFYAALDVVAHPAVDEPFGLAVVEAMASERPVVAGSGGGIPEIIRDGVDGLLIQAGQPDPLADALILLLADGDRVRSLTASARQRVIDCFTPRHQAESMLAVYRAVLGNRHRGRGVAAQ